MNYSYFLKKILFGSIKYVTDKIINNTIYPTHILKQEKLCGMSNL